MHYSRITLLAALALGAVSSLCAMNNDDLVKLKKAGMSDETILASVNREKPEFDTSADGLIELKEAGISEAVIQRVIARKSGETAPAASTTTASSSVAAANPSGNESELFSVESPKIAPPIIVPAVGQDYFLRFSLHEEDNEYPITNYARGSLVPINTPVKLISLDGKNFTLKRLDSSETIKVENIEKYSKRSTSEVAGLLLSSVKTPIEQLVPALQKAILAGEPRKGMTKEQVIMARGYPPAHETPSLDLDRWVYWSSRFVKQTLVFNNDRLIEGRGIY
ncbi:MAG TPA: hypothetical protein VFT72_07605 [Opitutaceae bacterium]|nr:hypothetical protein [Opitutaceae bacterium]